MSRGAAKKNFSIDQAFGDMYKKGIIVKAASKLGLVEEMPETYKNVDDVIEVVVGAGLARKVIKTKPLMVMKG